MLWLSFIVGLVYIIIALNIDFNSFIIMDKEKIYKTIEILVKAVVAIAAVWLCVSCTMSLSVSKHNTNSHQNTEQSQATSVDSTTVDLNYK